LIYRISFAAASDGGKLMVGRLTRRILYTRIVVLLCVAALTGCVTNPGWVILNHGEPDALLRQNYFAVEPIDFSDVRVGVLSESVYLTRKDEKQRVSWASDKAEVNAKFFETLTKKAAEVGIEIVSATAPNKAPFVVHIHASRIEPGYYVGITTQPGMVSLDVTISSVNGKPCDRTGAGNGCERILFEMLGPGFTVTQRLGRSGGFAGEQFAKYLRSRSFPNAGAK
jgi:hypothetical protein